MSSTSAPISAPPSTVAHALIRYGFAPFMLLGVNGITVWLAAEEVGVIVHILVILGAIAATFGAERVLPYTVVWNRDRGDSARDVAHAFVDESLSFLSMGAIPVLTAVSEGGRTANRKALAEASASSVLLFVRV